MINFDDNHGMLPAGSMGGVVEFRDAYVLGKYQIAFNCDVYVPPGCKAATISKEEILSIISHVSSRRGSSDDVEELDAVVVIAQFWGDSYYHALIEDLPRLALALDILHSDPRAAILSYPQSFMSRESLFNRLPRLRDSRKWISSMSARPILPNPCLFQPPRGVAVDNRGHFNLFGTQSLKIPLSY
jgi:hypothetical protein